MAAKGRKGHRAIAMDFPAGPGVGLSGIVTPDSRCGALRRELWRMIRPAIEAGERLEDHPLVAGHLRQLRFAEDRFSASANENMQVSRGHGNAEFRGPGDPPCSEQKPAGLSTTEVARMLEMTPRSVLNLIYRGSLKGTRSARGWIVDMGSVAELYEQRRKGKQREQGSVIMAGITRSSGSEIGPFSPGRCRATCSPRSMTGSSRTGLPGVRLDAAGGQGRYARGWQAGR